MGSRILAEEHCERRAVERLRTDGHDVERVVTVEPLGPGSDDEEIVAYASREDRLLLTGDDDFLSVFDADERPGVLFLPNERVDPDSLADVVSAQAFHLSQDEFPDVVYVTEKWL